MDVMERISTRCEYAELGEPDCPAAVELDRLRRELAEARMMILNYQLEGRDGSGIDRLRRELAEAQRERDERMRWIRELWEACEVNGCLPDSGVADEIRTAMIADAAMPAP